MRPNRMDMVAFESMAGTALNAFPAIAAFRFEPHDLPCFRSADFCGVTEVVRA